MSKKARHTVGKNICNTQNLYPERTKKFSTPKNQLKNPKENC